MCIYLTQESNVEQSKLLCRRIPSSCGTIMVVGGINENVVLAPLLLTKDAIEEVIMPGVGVYVYMSTYFPFSR